MLISHWMCKNRDWSLLRSLYESIIEEVECGEAEWQCDFSSYETMIPPQQAVVETRYTEKKIKQSDVYWCKAYQTNSCELKSPHMAM